MVALATVLGCGKNPTASTAAPNKPATVASVESLVGKPMPAFRMVDLAGKVYTNESVKGKIVIIDFWATWCPPCRASSPILQTIQTKYESKGLVILGANVSEGDQPGESELSKEKVTEYSGHRTETYTLTIGNDALAGTCGITGLPTFLIIDRKGIVREVQVGRKV